MIALYFSHRIYPNSTPIKFKLKKKLNSIIMNKISILAMLTLLFACNSVSEPKPVDIASEKIAVKQVITSLFQSIEDRDIEKFASFFSDEGIFMGNTPVELFQKDTIVKGWTQLMQMPEIPTFEFIGDPLIRMQPDGKTAIYVTQYYWNLFTQLPLRQSFWLVKDDDIWSIDFFDFSVVPYNEQFPAINKAIMNNHK